MSKKIYGPSFPVESSEIDVKPQSSFNNIDFEISGPLPPQYEVLRDPVVFDVKKPKDDSGRDWLTGLLNTKPKSMNLKPRNFSMRSGDYDPHKFQTAQPTEDVSLMDMHRDRVAKEKLLEEKKAIKEEKKAIKEEKKAKKREERKAKKRLRSSSSDSDHKKRKKKRSSSSEKDRKKKKKSKKEKKKQLSSKPSSSASAGIQFKWDPFSQKSSWKPFDREAEMGGAGSLLSGDKRANLMKEMGDMHSQFVTARRK